MSAFQIVKEHDFLMKTIFKNTIASALKDGGAMRDRTADLLAASEALSQLSYSPIWKSFSYSKLLKPNQSVWTLIKRIYT